MNGRRRSPPQLSLARYGSGPSSMLSIDSDAAAGAAAGAGEDEALMRGLFSGEQPPASFPTRLPRLDPQRSFGAGEISLGVPAAAADASGGGGDGEGGGLRQSSGSPAAGFFSNLLIDGGCCSRGGEGVAVHAVAGSRKQKPQLSFGRQDSLLQISEDGVADLGEGLNGSSHSDDTNTSGHQYQHGGFSIGSWDDMNSITFGGHSSGGRRAKEGQGDFVATLNNYESQFTLPRTSLEMSAVEKYLQVPQEPVPFKIRAKRGCATHPRSIAERERRTRISAKLRKLQELVPNMDKQTSTADMLDLAVQHIKGLQTQLEVLNQERENCTCGGLRRGLN